jgi:hypothetical protein
MDAFKTLNNINVNDHTERKNGLTYLAWAWAWGELKKLYPQSYYTVYENKDGLFYHTDGKTCWVKTGVTLVDGDIHLEHIEYLPVMDMRNKSIAVEAVTSFDVNKAIQRSLTKAVARHGLGLYIYAGEDLPEEEAEAVQAEKLQKRMEASKPATVTKQAVYDPRPEIAAIKKRFNIDDSGFANMRKALVDGGVVENKPSSEMKEEDWKKLFYAIETNFGDAA